MQSETIKSNLLPWRAWPNACSNRPNCHTCRYPGSFPVVTCSFSHHKSRSASPAFGSGVACDSHAQEDHGRKNSVPMLGPGLQTLLVSICSFRTLPGPHENTLGYLGIETQGQPPPGTEPPSSQDQNNLAQPSLPTHRIPKQLNVLLSYEVLGDE